MSSSMVRVAVRGSPRTSTFFRANNTLAVRPPRPPASRMGFAGPALMAASGFSTTTHRSSEHHDETFEEFTARFEKEFENVHDVFELQRNLNNAFAYDLVPSPSVIAAAVKAARRVNDFPTAVRIFEGIKAKVENKRQYEQYLEELKPLRDEFGIPLKEELYPDVKK